MDKRRGALLRGDEPVRRRSDKMVKKVGKKLGGRTTVNSGATFSENDLTTDDCDIEHKFTDKKQFTVKLSELEKLRRRSHGSKVPVFMIEFPGNSKRKYVVIDADDFFNR